MSLSYNHYRLRVKFEVPEDIYQTFLCTIYNLLFSQTSFKIDIIDLQNYPKTFYTSERNLRQVCQMLIRAIIVM